MIGVIHGNDRSYYDNAANYSKQLSVCVCVSNELKGNLLARCKGIDPAIVHVISCGINLPDFAPVMGNNDLLKLVFIGRIEDKVKRGQDLVSIAKMLHEKGVKFHLTIIGNSAESAFQYTESLKGSGVAQCITFKGWLLMPEIQQCLNNSDVLLLTSASEGMPIVMMEALASGCCFVGTRVGGIKDYEHHPLALDCFGVYALGDIADAVLKIKAIGMVSREWRVKSARALAEREFTMQVCLQKYLAAIDNIKTREASPSIIRLSLLDKCYSSLIAFARNQKVKFSTK